MKRWLCWILCAHTWTLIKALPVDERQVVLQTHQIDYGMLSINQEVRNPLRIAISAAIYGFMLKGYDKKVVTVSIIPIR